MKDEIKKEWGTPTSNVQRFEPQEYCAGCSDKSYKALSTLGAPGGNNYVFIDFDGDTYYDDGERTNSSGKVSNSYNGGPYTVNIYYMHQKGSTDGYSTPINKDTNPPYSSFTQGKNTYVFEFLGTKLVMVNGGTPTYKNMS